jgi:transposase, IS5 family
MYSEQSKQISFYDEPLYERTVPKDHFLRRLSGIVDFKFVNELCKDLYSPDTGRPCWEPQLMFKVLFLQFLYDLSDREIEAEIGDRMSFKWFLGLPVDESVPDYSMLSRFRDRLGPERFATIFNRIVETARSHKLVSDKLHIIDATDVKARVDQFRISEEIRKSKEQDNDKGDGTPSGGIGDKQFRGKFTTPDPDARFGRKSDSKKFYGYKEHIRMDAESEIIVDCKTTPGNEQDCEHFGSLLSTDPPPGVITADRGYDSGKNHRLLAEKGIRNGIMLKGNHTKFYTKPKRVSNVAKKFRNRIEHMNAELKNIYSLKVARYWGLAKVTIQAYMTAIAANCKRMLRLLESLHDPPRILLRSV